MARRACVRSHYLPAAVLLTALASGPAAAAAESYELDPAHTQIQFSVDRFGFTNILGTFLEVEGTLQLDEEDPAESSVRAVISAASLDAGNQKRNEALNGKFWFDTRAHSEIRFKSTSVEPTGERAAKVSGLLTIKGVTKPVVLDVTLNKLGQDPATQRQAAGFTASTRILRSDFGMTTAQELIGDEVSIRIEALAHRPAK